jgi:ABC-type dipeptide/oligopeptide/nickel transport system ATPase component
VLRDLALEIWPGEILGLVGQSGSGKSTLALAILRLLEFRGGKARGQILFQGRDLMRQPARQMRRIRGKEIGLVFQSTVSSLNPALTIGRHLREAWKAHPGPGLERGSWTARVRQLLADVSLPSQDGFLSLYPSQLSVGLAQRVLIAMAILHRPSLLIADEPTSALDVITQAEVLALFGSLSRRYNMSVLFVSHDLLAVAALCHRVAILHEGHIVEVADTREIFLRPRHPYTRRLIAALPGRPYAAPEPAEERS